MVPATIRSTSISVVIGVATIAPASSTDTSTTSPVALFVCAVGLATAEHLQPLRLGIVTPPTIAGPVTFELATTLSRIAVAMNVVPDEPKAP